MDRMLIRTVRGERFTPFALAKKLKASVILESASIARGRSRYSILLVREAFRAVQAFGGAVFERTGGKSRPADFPCRDILDYAEARAAEHSGASADFPIPAGGVGFLSFEFARYCDAIRLAERPDPLGLPEAAFVFGHVFAVFDHLTDSVTLLALNYRDHEIDLARALDETEASLGDLDFNYLRDSAPPAEFEILDPAASASGYIGRVKAIKEEILAGNLLQCVPSRRLEIASDLDALEAYRTLRTVNPSPYLFYLDFGDFQLVGASPESHVKVEGRTATLRPIAGTRRRGGDAEEDAALERELRACPKENAEHVMLVDLARNDLSRVCAPGTVKVTEAFAVERHARVMHLVSRVTGELVPGTKASDVIRATFPAGTVSGAPKIRAIETIAALEPFPRGFYAGLVGYVEANGNMDSCISIRCAARRGGRYYLQAGGGVVHDSTPERELEETGEKLAGMLAALGSAKPGGSAA